MFFAKSHKSPLLICNRVKGAGQFLATERPWKIMKTTFFFHLKKLNMLLANQILQILCIFIKSNVWYSWSLKILTMKRWFLICSTSQKFYRVAIFQKTSNFYQTFLLRATFKILYWQAYCYFVCLLLIWSKRYSLKWSSNFDGP